MSDNKLASQDQLLLQATAMETNVSASETPNQIVAATLTMKKLHEGNIRPLQSLKSAQYCDSDIVLCLAISSAIETYRDH